MTIHLDISQLVLDPRRSGIQRAERELIRHWPGSTPLVPCHFDHATGTMQELPDQVFQILCEDAPVGGVKAELASLAKWMRPVRTATPARLVNAELFADPQRANHYCHLPASCRPFWLVYDFLPWLHPDWFSIGSPLRLMPYLNALRHVDDVAFISSGTRDDYSNRIVHRPATGPVIPMGGDGLGLERQSFDAHKNTFVMLGTIEARKNALPVMQAFQRLWADGVDVKLVLIGIVAQDAVPERLLISKLQHETRFSQVQNLPDSGVRDLLRTARAMVFPSEGEGYGIPPMEALHAGIPVIVSKTLPALVDHPTYGQIRLDRVDPDTIADAVMTAMNDTKGHDLWREAAKMPSFGWADFAAAMADWVQS